MACTAAMLLGAYYYTWYGFGEQWQVFPRPFEPVLGEYKSFDASVMKLHHQWARAACIDFFAVSWGGDGTRAPNKQGSVDGQCKLVDSEGKHSRPRCTREGKEVEPARGKQYVVEGWKEPLQWWSPSGEVDQLIQRHLEVEDGVPMALMYEVRDVLGVGEGGGSVDLMRGDNPRILEHHLLYAAEHYFLHPNYMRVDGCPVLFLYTLRDFQNFVEPLNNAIKKVQERIGRPLFIIGDILWWNPSPSEFPWDLYKAINLSSVTGYNLYDAGQPDKMDAAFSWQSAYLHAKFGEAARRAGMGVVPYVSPGYDDRKMRGGGRAAIERAEGAQYLKAWKELRRVIKCQGGGRGEEGGERKGGRLPMALVNSFNEWHEGTQIEPSREFGESYLKWTRSFKNLVAGEEERGSGSGNSSLLPDWGVSCDAAAASEVSSADGRRE
ncbi:hypothetical protein GUITHDRAFT_149606, partial [Guillardia theta CCMP2712]